MIDTATGWYVTPTSVKAVVADEHGAVLLGLNPRGEWELPGGWPDPGDLTLEDVAAREVAEESGLAVTVGPLIAANLHRASRSAPAVVLVVLSATAPRGGVPVISGEHSRMAFFPVDDLPEPLAPSYREAIALAAGA